MVIIYCDKHANRPPNSYRLIILKGGWHVVANGYLCKVADAEEGRKVIAGLSAGSSQGQPLIDKA